MHLFLYSTCKFESNTQAIIQKMCNIPAWEKCCFSATIVRFGYKYPHHKRAGGNDPLVDGSRTPDSRTNCRLVLGSGSHRRWILRLCNTCKNLVFPAGSHCSRAHIRNQTQQSPSHAHRGYQRGGNHVGQDTHPLDAMHRLLDAPRTRLYRAPHRDEYSRKQASRRPNRSVAASANQRGSLAIDDAAARSQRRST